MVKRYDYLVVGAGLFGATFAHEAHKHGKKVLVIDKRNHVAGNIYTEKKENINVHKYGAHIFHTDNKTIWDYVNSFVTFNYFVNSPIARYKNEVYNMPFNMNTFSKIWPDVFTPDDAHKRINEETKEITSEPKNLEEQAISLVGRTIYEKLVKGYTEKQWNKDCKDLPAFIIKRLPVRLTYDNNYFNDKFQGIPEDGYTKLVEKMLQGIEVRLNENYFDKKEEYQDIANKILFTGMIDEYFEYQFGKLEYRSLRFEEETLNIENYQGNPVVNYTERKIPYTRIIEHKHFEKSKSDKTIITKEYPLDWDSTKEAYYAINDEKNNSLLEKYKAKAKEEKNIIFGGRLAEYKYYDMDDTIESALKLAKEELK